MAIEAEVPVGRGCPTLRLAWAKLSEEGLSWAAYTKVALQIIPPTYLHGNYN